jgi:hypothetical protein
VNVHPGPGKDSGPGFASPKYLSTDTKLGAGWVATASTMLLSTASAPNGTRHCHWRKPRRPYMRGQLSMASRGYQKLSMVRRWSRRRRGAFRYHTSLKAVIDARFSRALGATGSDGAEGSGRYASGSRRRRSRGDRSSRVAKSPWSSTARPRERPVAVTSTHATE